MKPWWEKWPGRLDFELDELRKADIKFELVQPAFKRGVVVLELMHVINCSFSRQLPIYEI